MDWSKIEGYREDMTAEEKLALLEKVGLPDAQHPPIDMSKYIAKSQFDKTASELAQAKRELKSRMSADEQKELDRQAQQQALMQELETLRKEKTQSLYKSSYLAQGYDETLAEEAATAMVDGDMDTVFAVMRKQAVIAEKSLRAKILKDTPTPPTGSDPSADDKLKKEQADLRRAFGLPIR